MVASLKDLTVQHGQVNQLLHFCVLNVVEEAAKQWGSQGAYTLLQKARHIQKKMTAWQCRIG